MYYTLYIYVFDDILARYRIVDYVIVFFITYVEHVILVRALFRRTLELIVALDMVLLVGYFVDINEFRPDPELTTPIKEFPTPRNSTDVRAILQHF